MKNACPACGAALSFVRSASSRFACPSCRTPLKSNAGVLLLIAIGITFILALPVFLVWDNDTLGGFYVMLLAELLVALVIYAALGRRYYTVTSDKDSG